MWLTVEALVRVSTQALLKTQSQQFLLFWRLLLLTAHGLPAPCSQIPAKTETSHD
jgi:hypothetical protein